MNLKTILMVGVLALSPGCGKDGDSSEYIEDVALNPPNMPNYGEMIKGKVGPVQHYWAWDVDGKQGFDEMITSEGRSWKSVEIGTLKDVLRDRETGNLTIRHYVAEGVNPEKQYIKSGVKGIQDFVLPADVRKALSTQADLFKK
jgi:hypothetical protein